LQLLQSFAAAAKRITSADCLVIDEISMLSKKTLEMVDMVCRHVRKTQELFGGLQVYFYRHK
jgi:nucleoside-triphosphatase THEP1